jgi:predicted N-acyltransferase
MVIFSRLQSFIIKNINSRCSPPLPLPSYLCALMFILSSFMASLARMYAGAQPTREISSSFSFALALSVFSREITCVSYFQQFHCCQHAEISESLEEEWRDLLNGEQGVHTLGYVYSPFAISPLRCFFHRCHKCHSTFFCSLAPATRIL